MRHLRSTTRSVFTVVGAGAVVVTLLASPGSAANTTPAVPSHRPAATAPVPRTPAPSPSGTAGSSAG